MICDYCPKEFIDTNTGLAEMMFHVGICHGEEINDVPIPITFTTTEDNNTKKIMKIIENEKLLDI